MNSPQGWSGLVQYLVETGIADSTFIQIRSGVRPGDEVVSGSYTVVSRRLKDGSKVTIEKAGKG